MSFVKKGDFDSYVTLPEGVYVWKASVQLDSLPG